MDESSSCLSFLSRVRVRSRSSARTFAAILAAALTLTLVLASGARAQTDDSDAIAKATQLNKDAVSAYQGHKTDEAKRLLKQALDLCDASGLDQHPIKARTLIHFGIVLIGGSKQRELGIKQFKKALAIQPDIALTKSLATPDLQQAFDEARGNNSGNDGKGAGKSDVKATAPDSDTASPADETPPEETATPSPAAPEPATPPRPAAAEPEAPAPAEPGVSSAGLDHEPITHARPGTAIPITVNVETGLKFEKIVLAYRPNGSTDYLGREMKQVDPGIYSAEIPNRATSGTLVAYYIEAQDKNGDPVAARGSAEKPLVIMLGEPRVAKKPSKGSDDDADSDDDDDDDDDENGARFFIGLQIGSGAGYATGNGDNDHNTQYSSGGIAIAQAGHFAPEFGYWIRPDLMLSVQIRYQLVTGTTEFIDANMHVHHAINYAFAAFAKATWALGHGRLKPVLSLALGGGQIRHVVKNAMYSNCGADRQTDCVDTISGGPVLAGAGAGIMYSLTPRVALLAIANTQIGAPDFTVNIDANVGAAYQF
jgi:hypothetical protein